jgi:hypothetical protein
MEERTGVGHVAMECSRRIFTDTLSCLDAENLRQMNITFAVQNYCKNTQQDVCCARRCDG